MSVSPKLQRVIPAQSLEFIFVYGSLRTGGIETLIVRMANYFVSLGIRVSICCTEAGELRPLLDGKVNFSENSKVIDLIKTARSHASRGGLEAHIVIVSFDPISAARALMIEAGLPKESNVVHISGVYHPRAYFMSGERKDRVLLNYLVASAVGKSRLFFMNEECKDSHARKWKTDLSDSPILALPVNDIEAIWEPSNKPMVRVVSVGRLVPFKAYNIGAAKIVRECLDRGVEITWDIFGDGPLHGSIQAEIDAYEVSDYLRLMGALDYRDFSKKVASYDLFVGIGTAVLEAGMAGVPTICATVDQTSRCYGYLQDLPFGNVGELQQSSPTIKLSDLIEQYSKTDKNHRNHLSSQSRMTAEMYGMPKFFEEIIRMVLSEAPAPSRIYKRMIAELYHFATESFLAKRIRYCTSSFR